ncbi:MAG: asparagine synthase (glutamine-hydrolyzing) [Steroidobacteraceae bacterium]
MCGIAGILDLADHSPPARGRLESMITRVRHRGPDGYGYHTEPGIGLAHARLSIIDLATGDQPIRNEDGTVWVVFNGEIFNYIELRTELVKAGHRFYTNSDTEVIVHLYEQYGLDFVTHLNGQFAIALWDRNARRLVLARDRVGIRPLHYCVSNGRLAFASEVKSLFATGMVKPAIDIAALAQVFSFWSTLPGNTVFAGISSLPPGHIMVCEADSTRITRYWDWDFDPEQIDHERSAGSYAEELRALLVDSVRLQLRADVPVGAYLSGGLDSSIVTAIIKTFSDTPLRSFSLAFADEEFDERPYQQAMVRHLGTDHTEFLCRREDIAGAFPRTIWHTETPILRTAPTPLMLLSQSVRDHGFKVVLTGEGADEVFGGYDIFREARVRRFMARQPGSQCRARLLDRLYPYLRNSPGGSNAMSQKFFSQGLEYLDRPVFAHVPRWQTTQRILRFMTPEIQQQLGAWNAPDALQATLPSQLMSWSPLGRDQYVEAHTLMSGYLLCSQGDRVAMASSIEGRFPYLDHRLIEFACRLPPRLKLSGLQEKYLLRRAFADALPPSVAQRVKQPYRAPDGISFFRDGKPIGYVAELLSPATVRAAGYFDSAAVEKLVRKFAAGTAIGFSDNMAFVGILSTMALHEMFVHGTDHTKLT